MVCLCSEERYELTALAQALLLQASLDTIESEFWKVVEEADEPVEVLYGADIDTTITGSGFPQKVGMTCLLHASPCITWTLKLCM